MFWYIIILPTPPGPVLIILDAPMTTIPGVESGGKKRMAKTGMRMSMMLRK